MTVTKLIYLEISVAITCLLIMCLPLLVMAYFITLPFFICSAAILILYLISYSHFRDDLKC